MWITHAHGFAFVLEHQDLVNLAAARQFAILLLQRREQADELIVPQLGQRDVVARVKHTTRVIPVAGLF